MNKVYVSTTFIENGQKIKTALDMLESAGIKNVELGSNHIYEKSFDYIKKYNFNFLIHNYFPTPKKDFVINIASLNKQIRDESLKQIKKSINFCKKIGGKVYTFHPGFIHEPVKAGTSKKNYDFVWENKNLKGNYDIAFNHMLISLNKIVSFAKKKKVKIAIETEGSYKKKYFLLMQKPEEYKKILKYFKPQDLGINLNIGHLNLASKAFNFSKSKFINMIKTYIVAFELSHNNGLEDQHLPIKKNAWYWKIINDPNFAKAYKVLEFRNTSINQIKKVINFF